MVLWLRLDDTQFGRLRPLRSQHYGQRVPPWLSNISEFLIGLYRQYISQTATVNGISSDGGFFDHSLKSHPIGGTLILI